MTELRFTVLGRPQPQGSARGVPVKRKNGKMGIAVTTDNPKLHSWRQDVGYRALQARPTDNITFGQGEPVLVTYTFFLAPPKKMPKGRTRPVVKPDVSKLIRAAEDAMTGIVYGDDAQIVSTAADKVYGLPERTEVHVRALAPQTTKENEGR